MYPEGTLVRVINNINNHWFEIGEIIAVELGGHSRRFVGRPTTRKTADERYDIGGGPWVKWEEVILADPELSLEEMLKECLE
jgi:hypothetical protein